MFYNSMASVVVLGAMGIRFAHGAPTTGAVRRAYTDFLGFPTYDDMSSSIAAPDLGWTSWLDQSSQTGTSAPSVQDVAILETQNLDPQSLEIQSPASAPSTDTNALFGGGIIAAESDARACACERIPDGFRNGCVYSNGDGEFCNPDKTCCTKCCRRQFGGGVTTSCRGVSDKCPV